MPTDADVQAQLVGVITWGRGWPGYCQDIRLCSSCCWALLLMLCPPAKLRMAPDTAR